MLKSIGQADSVYVTPHQPQQPQAEEPKNQYQVSYRGVPNFERNPDHDDFQRGTPPEKPNKGGAALGLFGTAILVLGALCLHKGNKVLKGKEASLTEKFKTGGEEIFTKVKRFVSEKYEALMKKLKRNKSGIDKFVEEEEKSFSESYTRSTSSVQGVKKNTPNAESKKIFESGEKQSNKVHEYQKMNKQDVQRQIKEEKSLNQMSENFKKENLTERQRSIMNRNNSEAQRAFSESRQIENLIPKENVEKLKKVVSNPVTKPIASAVPKQAAETAKKAKNAVGAVKPKIRAYSKIGKTAVKPIKKSQAVVRKTSEKIMPEVDKRTANEIKSLEGNIKKLKQRIEGAKKFGKNTANLQKELETNQQKLNKAKQKIAEKAEKQVVERNLSSSKKVAERKSNERMNNLHNTHSNSAAGQNKNNTAADLSSNSIQVSANYKPHHETSTILNSQQNQINNRIETVHDLAGKRFNEISGQKAGANVIHQYDKNGKIARTIFDRGNGLVEIKEFSGNNPNGVSYLVRDGIVIKKLDAEMQTENMRRLVHSLKGVDDKNEVKKIVDSYASKYGMKEVNKTVMINGKPVKVIYKGFDCDITADGRVLRKRYMPDGKSASHSDITELLSQQTPEKNMVNKPHKKQEKIRA